MFCWVLGLLVLPTVPPLVLGVFAGDGVVVFGLGVGGGAGVGVAVTGPCFGRGWFGVARCGRLPLLAEGLVGLPLCPSGFCGSPAAPLAGGCWVLVLRLFMCCVRLRCGRWSRFGVWCAFSGSCQWRLWRCVLCARVGVCAVGWWCVQVPVLAFLGLVWRLGVGAGAVCCGPSPAPAVGSGCGFRHPWLGSVGVGVSPRRPLCLPSSLCLFAASLGAVFPWCLARAFPAVVGG